MNYLTYKTKIEQIQRYAVLDFCGSTAQRTVANEGTTHVGQILTGVFFKHQKTK